MKYVHALLDRSVSTWRRQTGRTLWLVGEKILLLVSTMVVGFSMVRFLGPDQFGRFSVALSITAVLSSLASMGLDTVLLRRFASHAEDPQKLLTAAIWTRLGGSLVHAAASWIAATLLFPQDRELGFATLLLACGAIFRAPEALGPWLQANDRYRDAVATRVAVRLIGDGLRIGLILHGSPMLWFAAAYVIESVVSLLAFGIVGRSLLREGLLPTGFSTWKLTREGLPILVSGLLSALYARLDQVVVFGIAGASTNGQYSAAVRLSELFNILVMSISAVAAAHFGRLHALPAERFNAALTHYYRGMLALGASISLGLSIFASPIVRIVYGASYEAAAGILRVHAWTVLLVFASVAMEPWFYHHRKLAYYIPKTLLALAFAIPAILIGTEQLGPIGTAAAVVATYFLSVVATNAILPGLRDGLRFQMNALTRSPDKR